MIPMGSKQTAVCIVYKVAFDGYSFIVYFTVLRFEIFTVVEICGLLRYGAG